MRFKQSSYCLFFFVFLSFKSSGNVSSGGSEALSFRAGAASGSYFILGNATPWFPQQWDCKVEKGVSLRTPFIRQARTHYLVPLMEKYPQSRSRQVALCFSERCMESLFPLFTESPLCKGTVSSRDQVCPSEGARQECPWVSPKLAKFSIWKGLKEATCQDLRMLPKLK